MKLKPLVLSHLTKRREKKTVRKEVVPKRKVGKMILSLQLSQTFEMNVSIQLVKRGRGKQRKCKDEST